MKRDVKPRCDSCGCNKSQHRYNGYKKGLCFNEDYCLKGKKTCKGYQVLL